MYLHVATIKPEVWQNDTNRIFHQDIKRSMKID